MKKVFLVVMAILALAAFMPIADAGAKSYKPKSVETMMELPDNVILPAYLDKLILAETAMQQTSTPEGISILLKINMYIDPNYVYTYIAPNGAAAEIPPYAEVLGWDGQKFVFIGFQFLAGDIAFGETKELSVEAYSVTDSSNKLSRYETFPATTMVKKTVRPR